MISSLGPCGLVAVLVAAPSALPAQTGSAETRADALKRHIVAIYDEDGRLLGSGASVSATGLILTAKHILEQRVGGSAPSYRMSVEVQAQRDAERRDATLVATHPHMDIAILDAPEGTLIPPLLVGTPGEATDDTWYSIGHPIGRTNDRLNPKLFTTMSGRWSEVEQRGGLFVMPGPAFDTGMSGGPVILGDRIVGIVSFASDKAYVAPVAVALDYFDLLGFRTSGSGLFERSDHIGRLAAKIDTYETILTDIQTDRRWICTLDAGWAEGGLDGLPETLDLTVHSERRLPSQPEINAKLGMSIGAEVLDGGDSPKRLGDLDGGFKYITEASPVAEFDNVIRQALDYAMGREIDPATATIRSLDFRVSISGISGDFIRTSGLPEYSVCCSFRLPEAVPAAVAGVTASRWAIEAARCPGAQDQSDEVASDGQ